MSTFRLSPYFLQITEGRSDGSYQPLDNFDGGGTKLIDTFEECLALLSFPVAMPNGKKITICSFIP